MKTKTRPVLKIVIPILSVLAMLLVLEIVIRIWGASHDKWGRRERMRFMAEAQAAYPASKPLFQKFYTNKSRLKMKNYPRMGTDIRDYEYPIKKEAGTIRIIGLGDSFAWGWGVYDNRLTVFKLLECWFNAEKRSPKVEVINFAYPGANIITYRDLIQQTVMKFDPDIILLIFNLNDVQAFFAMVPFEAWAQIRLQKNPDFLAKISKLYEFIKLRIIKKKLRDWTIQDYHDSFFGKTAKERWELSQEILLKIAASCQSRRVTLVVSIFPLLFELEKNYPFQTEVDAIETFLKDHRIRVHNLLPDFIGKKSHLLWTLPTDSHPNEVGHRIAAESLYNYLIQNQLVPAPN